MNKTRVVRSWSKTFVSLVVGVVAIGVSVLMFQHIVEGAISAGFALIPGIVGIVALYYAVAGASSAPCPSCGARVGELSSGSNDGACCAACHAYFEGKQGEVWPTDPQRIADSPLFATKLGEQFAWPDGCCVCGQAAVRSIPITAVRASSGANAATAVATGGAVLATGRTTFTLEVPHCGQHDNGAHLSAGGSNKEMRILFRSYPYLRSFCQRNGTLPG
ncbi:MAG TPA: hypothetical protein VGG28_00375 [Kofleriaceae bacterium]|jgi:hypothetical protein